MWVCANEWPFSVGYEFDGEEKFSIKNNCWVCYKSEIMLIEFDAFYWIFPHLSHAFRHCCCSCHIFFCWLDVYVAMSFESFFFASEIWTKKLFWTTLAQKRRKFLWPLFNVIRLSLSFVLVCVSVHCLLLDLFAKYMEPTRQLHFSPHTIKQTQSKRAHKACTANGYARIYKYIPHMSSASFKLILVSIILSFFSSWWNANYVESKLTDFKLFSHPSICWDLLR